MARALLLAVALLATTAGAREPTLRALERDVTVVAFFSTACVPCRDELPRFAVVQKQLDGDTGVRLIALSVDGDLGADGDAAARARAMAAKLGVLPPVVVDARAYRDFFGTDEITVPRLAVYDRGGRGLERNGARAGESNESFARELTAAIAAVRAHSSAPPTPMWQPLAPRKR